MSAPTDDSHWAASLLESGFTQQQVDHLLERDMPGLLSLAASRYDGFGTAYVMRGDPSLPENQRDTEPARCTPDDFISILDASQDVVQARQFVGAAEGLIEHGGFSVDQTRRLMTTRYTDMAPEPERSRLVDMWDDLEQVAPVLDVFGIDRDTQVSRVSKLWPEAIRAIAHYGLELKTSRQWTNDQLIETGAHENSTTGEKGDILIARAGENGLTHTELFRNLGAQWYLPEGSS